MPTLDAVRAEYEALWSSLEIDRSRDAEVKRVAQQIFAGRRRYDEVSAATSVPWWLIGLIHQMECGGNFRQHLHNGDPLSARTVQVPKGRPVEGAAPFKWEVSAIDALRYDKLDTCTDWSIASVCYWLERYNGWGSRNHGVHTPYLWAWSNHHSQGKYVSDGHWVATAKSEQPGAMCLLKMILEIDPTAINVQAPDVSTKPWPKAEVVKAALAPSKVTTAATSRSVWYGIGAMLTAIANTFKDVKDYLGDLIESVLGLLPSAVDASSSVTSALQSLASTIKADLGWLIAGITVFCCVRFILRHVDLKHGQRVGEGN